MNLIFKILLYLFHLFVYPFIIKRNKDIEIHAKQICGSKSCYKPNMSVTIMEVKKETSAGYPRKSPGGLSPLQLHLYFYINT